MTQWCLFRRFFEHQSFVNQKLPVFSLLTLGIWVIQYENNRKMYEQSECSPKTNRVLNKRIVLTSWCYQTWLLKGNYTCKLCTTISWTLLSDVNRFLRSSCFQGKNERRNSKLKIFGKNIMVCQFPTQLIPILPYSVYLRRPAISRRGSTRGM